MELKKTPDADLQNKRFLFGEIGAVIVLGLLLWAFETPARDTKIDVTQATEETVFEEEMIQQTRQEEVKPPPPPPPPKLVEAFNIVEDDADINEEEVDFNTEAEEDTEITFQEVEVAEEPEEEEEEIFLIAEQMPVFPGGDEALRKYLAQSVKYPVIAQENGIQGRVFVSFVINQKGEVTNVKVARPFDPNLDKEAVRVVQSMPKWAPGMQRGKAVKVSYTVPINFVLQ